MSDAIREQPPLFREWWRVLLRTAGLRDASGASPARAFAVAVLAAAFMAVIGPFGTWKEPLSERLGFWIIGTGGSVCVGFGLDRCLRRISWLRHRSTLRALANVALVAAPAGLIASAAAAIIQGAPIDWPLYWQTVPQILLMGVGFVALFHLAARQGRPADSPAPEDPTLGGLLPLKLSGACLLAIEAEDHYVRVHTDRGASLMLMAFETALAKVAHLDGTRVHRSWWVARAAVISIQRGDGRATLSLPGAIQAPVSRRYARILRSAGWY
jgi:hypothetical protein